MGFSNTHFQPASGTLKNSPRLTAYLWAHVYPIVVYAFFSLFVCLIRFVTVTDSYESADLSIPFDDSKDPFYAAHVSDLHHTNIRPERMILNHRKIGNISYRFNPPVFSFGGDLIDALNSTNILSFHKQYEINWHRYNTTRLESSIYEDNRVIFEIAGNHDMMVVSEDNMIKNRYRYYTMKPDDPLSVRSYQFDDYSVPINIILFNIIRPPFTSGPLGVFPCTHDEDVQLLEDSIKRNYKNIIITHFPFSHWWSLTTTRKGNGLRDVGHLASLLLTGHLHPSYDVIERKKNALSVIVPALFESYVFAMPFIDNGGPGVQDVDTSDPNDVVLITYPLPKSQLTGRSVFNLNTFPIRVYQFAPNEQNLSAFIDGNYVGQMKHLRKSRRHVHFYTLNVTVNDGDHTLKVGSTEINFFVGDKIPSVIEIGNNNLYSPDICIYGAFRTLFFLLLLLLPFWKLFPNVISRYQVYVFNEDNHEINDFSSISSLSSISTPNPSIQQPSQFNSTSLAYSPESFPNTSFVNTQFPNNSFVNTQFANNSFVNTQFGNNQILVNNSNDDDDYKWFHHIFLGPLYLITRARFVPKNLYILFWIIVTLFLVCPMYMMQDDQYLAIVFIWGAYIHGTFSHYAMCFVLWIIHIFFFCQGGIVAVSFWFEIRECFTRAQWIEFALYLIFTAVGPIGWYILGYLAGGFFTVITSPITWLQIIAVIYTAFHLKRDYEARFKPTLTGINTESSVSSIYSQGTYLQQPLI
ncbi:hypothetical protein TRFO_03177 [Tritrichomonas foetus]|uniref:Calcineurin-like phosphoesterase domain-containing protein n=1 Tax=Tritrichomonas foetus TaxID=1144522 RepID=A0A1J4KSA4_9EUKA|nr:hypothetical protein TRFO_03177 [Tritrichomonas foetus]|eukprot:OHT14139.1 hypothetical protein TRFO_03177 [Tritrichomonas foetus]